jgi:hypothetical protein
LSGTKKLLRKPLQLSPVVDCEYARQKEEQEEALENKEDCEKESRCQEVCHQEDRESRPKGRCPKDSESCCKDGYA